MTRDHPRPPFPVLALQQDTQGGLQPTPVCSCQSICITEQCVAFLSHLPPAVMHSFTSRKVRVHNNAAVLNCSCITCRTCDDSETLCAKNSRKNRRNKMSTKQRTDWKDRDGWVSGWVVVSWMWNVPTHRQKGVREKKSKYQVRKTGCSLWRASRAALRHLPVLQLDEILKGSIW